MYYETTPGSTRKANNREAARTGAKPRPVAPEPEPGLAPKTVVNVHRMLHRVWEDASRWGYVRRNVVADASPPRTPAHPGCPAKLPEPERLPS
jgi:hypothetical protein